MLARNSHEQLGGEIPSVLEKMIQETLDHAYQEELRHFHKKFCLFGEIYHDELSLAVSLLSSTKFYEIPITLFISVDLTEKDPLESVLGHLLDAVSIILDELFTSQLNVEYFSEWEEFEFKDKKYYYHIGREDIALTRSADQLLK